MSRRADSEVDRRVRKTRHVLREALIALMLERSWDSISVRDICERADVARSTFYVHFADKENLLLSGFDELHQALEALRAGGDHPFSFFGALAAHMSENKRLAQALVGRQSWQQMQWRFLDVLATLVESELKALKVPRSERPLAKQFIAGGAAEALSSWLEQSQGGPPEKLVTELKRAALAVVQAFQARQ